MAMRNCKLVTSLAESGMCLHSWFCLFLFWRLVWCSRWWFKKNLVVSFSCWMSTDGTLIWTFTIPLIIVVGVSWHQNIWKKGLFLLLITLIFLITQHCNVYLFVWFILLLQLNTLVFIMALFISLQKQSKKRRRRHHHHHDNDHPNLK